MGHRIWTLDEANAIIPLLERITKKCEDVVTKTLQDQRFYISTFAPEERIKECDDIIGKELIEWGTKLTKLGATVYSHGYVGLDNGTFFYSWHHGEKKIAYIHGHMEGPGKRTKLDDIMLQIAERVEGNKDDGKV